VRFYRIVDVEVEVHLLRRAVGPVGRRVLRRELNPDPPLASRVDDGVKRVVDGDVAVQPSCPEGALGAQVCSVEDDLRSYGIHEVTI
jgi:hypothetical protein